MSYFVRCNSGDRTQGTIANFIVDTSRNNPLQNVSGFSINLISFPNTQPNISLGKNTLQIEDGGGVFTVTVPAVQYDCDGLAAALQAAILVARPLSGMVVTCVNQDSAPRFQFASATAFRYFTRQSSAGISTMSRWLGITDGTPIPVLNYTGASPPNLAGVTVVSVQCQTLTLARGIQARDTDLDREPLILSIMCEIPITVPWGEYQSFEPFTPNEFRFSAAKNITSLSFAIRDATNDGELLYGMSEPGATY